MNANENPVWHTEKVNSGWIIRYGNTSHTIGIWTTEATAEVWADEYNAHGTLPPTGRHRNA